MKTIAAMFLIIGALLMAGTGKYLIDLNRTGMYPPKKMVRKRAAALAGGGGIFIFSALVFFYFF